MRAVNSGNDYFIYDNSVNLYNGLPANTYQINFNPQSGYSLSKCENMNISEKVYGIHHQKVEKVMRSFKIFQRSLGVILSGDKGIGKSLFSKMLCVKAVSEGYPVIICNGFTPGIARFIDSIDQECVIYFDEFDKTFGKIKDSNDDAQTSMLSLFDGVSMNKKLFCVTCNEINSINQFLVNRPGRFHYHFRFEYPTSEEIEIYIKDHVSEDKWSEISKITTFAKKTPLNYDCLRAISFELNSCSTFEEAINDLNIIKDEYLPWVNIYLLFEDGSKMRDQIRLDMFSSEETSNWFGCEEINESYLEVSFAPDDATWNTELGCMMINANNIKIKEEIDDEDSDIKSNRSYVDSHRAKDVVGLIFKTNTKHNIRYFA